MEKPLSSQSSRRISCIALPVLSGLPVFIAAGRNDPLVRPENIERLAAMLRNADANVTLHSSPAGHQLTSDELEEARRWLVETFPAASS